MKPTVILFDVDGVLVQPGGYRAAVQATVNYFTRQMGLGELAPDSETIAIFEAQGITCEWDMVPLLLAMIFEEARARQPEQQQAWDSIEDAVGAIAARPLPRLTLDYPGAIRALVAYVTVGAAPADSILAACQSDQAPGPFPRLAGQGLLRQLLSYTRRPRQSLTTQIFTNFVLGDVVYARDMGLPALLRSESLLKMHDHPLLDHRLAEEISQRLRDKQIRAAAYTARPSIPDGDVEAGLAVFSPEAEMAVRQVGLDNLLIVGSGQMSAAALALDENEDRLTKPAPYHAVAAVLSALTGDRRAALAGAAAVFRWLERGERPPHFDAILSPLPGCLTLHIFEDSPSGIQGGKAAVEILSQLGLEIDLRLWGVTAHPDKAAALARSGARVYADINQALAASELLAARA